jgi:hypothetical protein
MKVFAPTNKGLGHLSLFVPFRFSLYFKFCLFLTKVSNSKVSCYGVSKGRLFICQSLMDYVEQAKKSNDDKIS